MDIKYLPEMPDETAQRFLKALHRACPIHPSRLLTDDGKEFTDCLLASHEREPSGQHEFDCQALGIEHRLTQPRTPCRVAIRQRCADHS